MKISRHKKVHRFLSFFCNNYGFRQPYQVLIDGTFCYAALKNKFNIREQMPKYLDGNVKLLTTQCVIQETVDLGHHVHGVLVIVKQFATHSCGHEQPVPGSTCIESMLGASNASRYIVATQDRELQAVARRIPGTPLLYLHQKAPTLENPSAASTRMARIHSHEKFGVNKFEEDTLTDLKKRKFGVAETVEEKKKKKKKGPNPLSCKKKSKVAANKEKVEEKHSKVKKRKRVKVAKHVKEHWVALAREQLSSS
ncbi:rRNA-processing protein UTP23 homolog [Periplaneta americana]|uniref:rRNA-processing protein UTP23 homolog n=1 Tax=Periplaneta americana TaxID=6978 RepID=UPI0037E7353D